MEISNKFKPIMKLVNLLAPNYTFSPRSCVGVSNKASYIDIHWVPELDSEYWAYVGFLRLSTTHIIPDKPTEILLAVPYLNNLTKNLIKDWKSIGIYFKACKDRELHHYYIIGIHDADSTK